MSKPTLRNLSLASIGAAIVGAIVFFLSFVGASVSTTIDASGSTSVSGVSGGNPALLLVGGLVLAAAGVAGIVAWIGGLIRTAQLQQWGWFVCMLLFGSLVTLLWSFFGTDAPKVPTVQYPQYPPQQPPAR